MVSGRDKQREEYTPNLGVVGRLAMVLIAAIVLFGTLGWMII